MGAPFTPGGSFAIVGFTMGLVLPYLERIFVGLHFLARADNLLPVRILYYACGSFNTRANDLLRVRILIRLRAMSKDCFNVLKI